MFITFNDPELAYSATILHTCIHTQSKYYLEIFQPCYLCGYSEILGFAKVLPDPGLSKWNLQIQGKDTDYISWV